MSTQHEANTPALTLINTRPNERAAALSDYLTARGVNVVAMPMLALTPCTIGVDEQAYLQAWRTGAYDALVVISPTAAEYGLAALKALPVMQQEGTVIAVGQRTLEVLHQATLLTASRLTMPEVSSNEGLIAMPELAGLQAGARVLIWRGQGGRRLLSDDLRARGVQVDSIAWYARTRPVAAEAQYHEWQRAYYPSACATAMAEKPWVLISSGAAFTHWAAVVTQPLHDFRYLVLGTRLRQLLHDKQLSYVMVDELSPAHIYQTLQSALLSK